MVIIYGKLLYCRGVSERNVDRKVSTLDYNNSTFYDCFNYPLTDEFCILDLNLPPIIFYDRPRLHKRAFYTPDLLPSTISVASENSFSNLTTPSDLVYLLPSDDSNTLHVMKKDVPFFGRFKIGYYSRKHD